VTSVVVVVVVVGLLPQRRIPRSPAEVEAFAGEVVVVVVVAVAVGALCPVLVWRPTRQHVIM
jgi:multisubunit Na+/H+ antiporter MnhB subunit